MANKSTSKHKSKMKKRRTRRKGKKGGADPSHTPAPLIQEEGEKYKNPSVEKEEDIPKEKVETPVLKIEEKPAGEQKSLLEWFCRGGEGEEGDVQSADVEEGDEDEYPMYGGKKRRRRRRKKNKKKTKRKTKKRKRKTKKRKRKSKKKRRTKRK